MESIRELFSNYVLNVVLLSWLSAQVLKTIVNFFQTNKLNLERMVGAGGMPSAHSASVCGLTVAIARSVGFGSPMFAIAFLLAAVVMYDAMGVRRAAGEHARVINLMVKQQFDGQIKSYIPKKKGELKEYLGHTPLQVLAGAMLGMLIAIVMPC